MAAHDPNPDLRALMQKAQQGDNMAYAKLLQEITRIIRPFLYHKMSDKTHLEDVVQETLISIHKARHTYQSSRPFLPWMFAIAHYRLQDHFRELYRDRKQAFTNFDAVKETLAAPKDHDHENADILRKSLSLLPEKQRIILEMMHIEGYTAPEIAQRTGMSLSAVKVSAHRAYKRLAKHFRQEAS